MKSCDLHSCDAEWEKFPGHWLLWKCFCSRECMKTFVRELLNTICRPFSWLRSLRVPRRGHQADHAHAMHAGD